MKDESEESNETSNESSEESNEGDDENMECPKDYSSSKDLCYK